MTVKEIFQLAALILLAMLVVVLVGIAAYCIGSDVNNDKKEQEIKWEIEEIVDYKVENAALKKENEKYKKLYNELIQEKIDKHNWEYLGDKK